MKVFLVSDNGGFKLKEEVKQFLLSQSESWSSSPVEIVDLSRQSIDPEEDYSDFVIPLAEKVVEQTEYIRGVTRNDSFSEVYGIMVCRRGGGEVMAANKVKGVRAVVCWRPDQAQTTRADADANLLCLPADYLDVEAAKEIVKVWLTTPFSQSPRQRRRLEKIANYEQRN